MLVKKKLIRFYFFRFFMFWLYAAPAARMTALQKLRTIGIATHDSIGIGEDGPTHQPIAYGPSHCLLFQW